MEEEIQDAHESILDIAEYRYGLGRGIPLEVFAAVEPGSGLAGLYAAMKQWKDQYGRRKGRR